MYNLVDLEILGLDGLATWPDIKAAHARQALKLHPDRNPGKESEFKPQFQQMQSAYERLRNLHSAGTDLIDHGSTTAPMRGKDTTPSYIRQLAFPSRTLYYQYPLNIPRFLISPDGLWTLVFGGNHTIALWNIGPSHPTGRRQAIRALCRHREILDACFVDSNNFVLVSEDALTAWRFDAKNVVQTKTTSSPIRLSDLDGGWLGGVVGTKFLTIAQGVQFRAVIQSRDIETLEIVNSQTLDCTPHELQIISPDGTHLICDDTMHDCFLLRHDLNQRIRLPSGWWPEVISHDNQMIAGIKDSSVALCRSNDWGHLSCIKLPAPRNDQVRSKWTFSPDLQFLIGSWHENILVVLSLASNSFEMRLCIDLDPAGITAFHWHENQLWVGLFRHPSGEGEITVVKAVEELISTNA